MKKTTERIGVFLALVSLSLCAIAVSAQESGKNARTTLSTSQIEQIIQPYVEKKQFMGAVLVAHGNDVLFSKGYGFADLEWNVPDSPETKFRLGSLTKQFTATAILLLEERGELRINDPVKKYIPDAPATWDNITLFNLLTHTSGIPNFTTFPDIKTFAVFPVTPEKLLAYFRDKPLDFTPGEKYQYSNSGYAVLGYIIEKVSGETYQKFLQGNIFTPLAMNDSGYDSNSTIIPRHASGYSSGKDGLVNANYNDMTVPYAAGGLYSTTGDLLRWEQSLYGGKLLSPSSLQKMTTPFKHNYALGLNVYISGEHKAIEHGGTISGFNATLVYYPDDQLAIIVLGNVNGHAHHLIARKLAELAGETNLFP